MIKSRLLRMAMIAENGGPPEQERVIRERWEEYRRTHKAVLDQIAAEEDWKKQQIARLQAVEIAARKLLEYRRRAGPLGFQLEKADDYLRELEIALGEKGQNDGHKN